jgi:predicted DNA-binding transcriptional regulator AlpA
VTSSDRQRRHDERWQAEVLDALARMLDVLHDLSDAVREAVQRIDQLDTRSRERPAADSAPALLSVADLAAELGISAATVRNLRAAGHGPRGTRIGNRIFFQRDDIAEWLQGTREDERGVTAPWRSSYLPGRIGSAVPPSSEPAPWCAGSHTEPLAASRYTGRAVCRVCGDDILVNRDGRLRKHRALSR